MIPVRQQSPLGGQQSEVSRCEDIGQALLVPKGLMVSAPAARHFPPKEVAAKRDGRWERRRLACTGAAGVPPACAVTTIDLACRTSRRDACGPSAGETPALPAAVPFGCLTRQAGFTLIEVVVAFTILALLATALFMSFRLAVNSYQKGQERMEQQAHKRVLEDQIKRQLGSLLPLRPALSIANLQQTGMEVADALTFAQTPLFYGDTGTMTFITVAPLMLLENPGLTVVRYGLAQDERGNHYLGAMEMRYLGIDSFAFMVRQPRGKPLPLIEPVQDLSFEYYGFDPQTRTYSWYHVWDTELLRSTPTAVRIHADEKTIVVPINATHSGGGMGTGQAIVGVGGAQ